MRSLCLRLVILGAVVVCGTRPIVAQGPSLAGWAMLPVDTYADGPTSGQFAGAGQFGHALPLAGKQPGEKVLVPTEEGPEVECTLRSIEDLPAEIKEWVK